MKSPATTWLTAVPTSVTRPKESVPTEAIWFCAVSSASLIWESVMFSGPVRSHCRTWSSPSVTCVPRSLTPVATWLLTNAIIREMNPTPKTTISIAAILREMPTRPSQPITGVTRAAISSAITSGSTTTRKKLSSQSTARVARPITMKRHDQAAARSTP